MRAIELTYRNGKTAALTVEGWSSADATLATALNLTAPYPDPDYPYFDPDPLLRVALAAAKKTGATVTSAPVLDMPDDAIA